jgi:hypothetical protein
MGTAVGLGKYRDDLNAHIFAGADNAQGNFAPVGYQNTLKHEGVLNL